MGLLDAAKARLQLRQARNVHARRANMADASCMGCGARGREVIVILAHSSEVRFCETCLYEVIQQVTR
jgi:hypothetical protein